MQYRSVSERRSFGSGEPASGRIVGLRHWPSETGRRKPASAVGGRHRPQASARIAQQQLRCIGSRSTNYLGGDISRLGASSLRWRGRPAPVRARPRAERQYVRVALTLAAKTDVGEDHAHRRRRSSRILRGSVATGVAPPRRSSARGVSFRRMTFSRSRRPREEERLHAPTWAARSATVPRSARGGTPAPTWAARSATVPRSARERRLRPRGRRAPRPCPGPRESERPRPRGRRARRPYLDRARANARAHVGAALISKKENASGRRPPRRGDARRDRSAQDP
jgi:hypothetical protein